MKVTVTKYDKDGIHHPDHMFRVLHDRRYLSIACDFLCSLCVVTVDRYHLRAPTPEAIEALVAITELRECIRVRVVRANDSEFDHSFWFSFLIACGNYHPGRYEHHRNQMESQAVALPGLA